MLLLSYLWDVSERMIKVLANDNLSICFFLALGADEKVPDHSTLTLFKNGYYKMVARRPIKS
jgi:hypothetical protein